MKQTAFKSRIYINGADDNFVKHTSRQNNGSDFGTNFSKTASIFIWVEKVPKGCEKILVLKEEIVCIYHCDNLHFYLLFVFKTKLTTDFLTLMTFCGQL